MAPAEHFEDAQRRKNNGSNSGDCVEAAYADGLIEVRDTKDHGGGPIRNIRRARVAFLVGVAAGEFTIEQLSA